MTQYGWFFPAADLRVRNPLPDGTCPHLAVGETQRETRPLVLGAMGFSGSVHLIDALKYSDSGMLSLCVYGGEIRHGDDQFCAETRTPIAIADITKILHEWACEVAEETVRKYYVPPDPRLLNGITVKRLKIEGKATDAEFAAAWDAAADGTRDAYRRNASEVELLAMSAARSAMMPNAAFAAKQVAYAARNAVTGGWVAWNDATATVWKAGVEAWNIYNLDLTARVLAFPEFAPFAALIEGRDEGQATHADP